MTLPHLLLLPVSMLFAELTVLYVCPHLGMHTWLVGLLLVAVLV